ncbi:hypothetical protein CRYUN_Cryun05aG0074800 [Craigia yunnanensis]
MKAISWNYQGIGPALTVQALRKLRRKYGPNLIFLMETKNGRKVLEKVRGSMRYVNSYYMDPEGLSGGLALWWDDKVRVKILEATKNCIDSLVTMDNKRIVSIICWIYESTDFEERKEQWEYIKKSMAIFKISWLCIGDFNKVKENEEKEGGRLRNRRMIDNFQEFINGYGLLEVPFKGQLYTWFNRMKNGLIRERLDRGLVNLL